MNILGLRKTFRTDTKGCKASPFRKIDKLAILSFHIFTILFCISSEVSAIERVKPKSTTITLTWTATGDDILHGQASYYDIRYSLTPINNYNWNSAIKVNNNLSPKYNGSPESFTVGGLNPNTSYYFAIKVADEFPNWSQISNVALIRTAFPPICGDIDESGDVDISDLVMLVSYMFTNGNSQFNKNAIDLDASGAVDISDLTYFIEFYFMNGPDLNCSQAN